MSDEEKLFKILKEQSLLKWYVSLSKLKPVLQKSAENDKIRRYVRFFANIFCNIKKGFGINESERREKKGSAQRKKGEACSKKRKRV